MIGWHVSMRALGRMGRTAAADLVGELERERLRLERNLLRWMDAESSSRWRRCRKLLDLRLEGDGSGQVVTAGAGALQLLLLLSTASETTNNELSCEGDRHILFNGLNAML